MKLISSIYLLGPGVLTEMARSRKDSTGSSVVDCYRKQIAKQDTKKSKTDLKESKFRAQKKENANAQFKEILIMIVAMVMVGCCIYLALYAVLSTKARHD